MKSNRDLIEATFLFPNKKDPNHHSYSPLHDKKLSNFDSLSQLVGPDLKYTIAARRSIDGGTNGNATDPFKREINGIITDYIHNNKTEIEEKKLKEDQNKNSF